jgi:hypothetical protein
MHRKLLATIAVCVELVAVAISVPCSARGDIVQNGSLEDLNSQFTNTTLNYMSLFAGSTAIADWTVSSATANEIVWAKTPTGDGQSAADGTFFVDLTGFGSDSPNGAIEQTLLNLIIGQQYAFSMDVDVVRSLPLVSVGGVPVTLAAGVPFTIGSNTWTPETGTFTAGATNPLLKIMNQQTGQQIDFIDNISVTGPTSSTVPEPSSLALFSIAVASLCLVLVRRCRAA